ncbi:unnamed protein product [Euphydryas editha]|uniref:Uncharacterized protein n=1 Tax=Euphydryas editha TaxID=104508 RepID=A0AAU9TTY3_EUPED|nr:unnamed protein product [Euphydryas editha]
MKIDAAVASVRYNTHPAVADPITPRRIAVDSIERRCVLYDLGGDGNTGNKIATMEMSDAAKGDATTADHCDECNNGILEMMVATIGKHKAHKVPREARQSSKRT